MDLGVLPRDVELDARGADEPGEQGTGDRHALDPIQLRRAGAAQQHPCRTVTSSPSIRNSLFRHDTPEQGRSRSAAPRARSSVAGSTRCAADLVDRVAADVGEPNTQEDDALAEVAAHVDQDRDQPDAAAQQRGRGMEPMPRAVDVLAPRPPSPVWSWSSLQSHAPLLRPRHEGVAQLRRLRLRQPGQRDVGPSRPP